MRNFKEKILGILLISILIFASFRAPIVYGKTEADELKELLDEYEEDLGDLKQLKKVVDVTYNDLYTATKVDDALKEKLREDISNFENIDGINPLILSVLDIELNSQVNNLDDDNIDDMREEISVIKEWVDAKVGTSEDDGKKDDNKNNGTNDGANNESASICHNVCADSISTCGKRPARRRIRNGFQRSKNHGSRIRSQKTTTLQSAARHGLRLF